MSVTGFAHPWWFVLLLVVGLLVAAYVWRQRSRVRDTMRFTNWAMLDKVAPRRPRRSQHAPAALLGVALILLVVALAGPTAEQKVPRNRAIVVLAIDVSLSMEATDVEPNRLAAAQEAAKQFATDLTPGINLGLISFAGSAVTLVAPTTDRKPVQSSIDGLKLAEATATGEAIFSGLQTVHNFAQVVAGSDGPPPARIVLLSDGKQTVPSFDLEAPRGAFTAAREAKKANIAVSTISFGTSDGTVDISGEQQPVPVDDDALHEVADLSGGEFYKAASAEQLKQVYDTLGEQIGYETKKADASRPWLVLGTVLSLLAAAGAIALNRRIP